MVLFKNNIIQFWPILGLPLKSFKLSQLPSFFHIIYVLDWAIKSYDKI